MRTKSLVLLHEATASGPRPGGLVGRLVAKHGIYYDATGPCLPQFYHCMPLIRVFHDDRTGRYAAIRDAGLRAGRDGIRFGYNLVESEDQDGGWWAGCHVPLDMGMELMVPVLDDLANHGLRAHIFGANNFGGSWDKEREWLRQLLQRIADAGHAETIGLFSWRNEPFMTSPYGGHSQESYTHGAEAMRLAQQTLGCTSSYGAMGEDDGYIAGTITYGRYPTNDGTISPSLPPGYRGDNAAIDFSRGHPGDLMVKRLDRAYYDGRYHGKYQGGSLWNVEPTGMNDDVPPGQVGDVYEPLDDPRYLWAYHMRGALDGMAVSFFNGPSVRAKYPIDTGYGFHEIVRDIRDWIPRDVGTWTGPTFMIQGNQFVTVLCETWGYIGPASHPLTVIEGRPIHQWRAKFASGELREGEGGIGFDPGWIAAVMRGTLGGTTKATQSLRTVPVQAGMVYPAVEHWALRQRRERGF